MFRFIDFDDLRDDEIKLVIKSKDEPDAKEGFAPRYGFSIVRIKDGQEVGVVYFAVDTSRRQYMHGHLSYGVSEAFRGQNYAAKACRLMKHVGLAHGFTRLFVGSGCDNVASRKTIEKLGAIPIAATDVPDADILKYLQGEEIDMFYWDIGGAEVL